MSAAEQREPVVNEPEVSPASAEVQVSDLHAFLRPVGNFRHADGGTMFELMSAYIVSDCNSLDELVDRTISRAIELLDGGDGSTPRPFQRDRYANSASWNEASDVQLRALQKLYFVRELLRRCFAEGVLKENLP